MSPPWRRTLLHSAVVVLIGILAGVVHVSLAALTRSELLRPSA
jgi:hypothetical protein